MEKKHIILIGAPVDCGKRTRGCLMGPDAYRTAGISEAITALGHTVADRGNLAPAHVDVPQHGNAQVYKLAENVGWTQTLMAAAQDAAPEGIPIFLGGDHALAAGTVAGMAAYAASQNRPFFLLWLDAHSDIHTPDTTDTGNLHGTPVGYVTGRAGFVDYPPLPATVDPAHICMIGLRSVDDAEHAVLDDGDVTLVDMRKIDEDGIRAPLAGFLDRVAQVNGLLHVSLDVDFLDPSAAPAVGTTVPGGATEREGHLVMEMLSDSGLVSSLDLVELNPFLDERGKTATLMVDLTASLLGRRVFDRPTRRSL
ncbi:arginase [Yoonia sediminilitoris]|uniref:Arginase n=1 Tax=Yoonia sediminilitoris TaxID=1286148 RepID=A0A2T6KD31_9RHOB|nr:arginase [Yoonia sediminilitoris]PUB12804.1 arginase [Yoonia sediminilitoris]RCW94283.1 arginase [Yoonia sediminilitoris]